MSLCNTLTIPIISSGDGMGSTRCNQSGMSFSTGDHTNGLSYMYYFYCILGSGYDTGWWFNDNCGCAILNSPSFNNIRWGTGLLHSVNSTSMLIRAK